MPARRCNRAITINRRGLELYARVCELLLEGSISKARECILFAWVPQPHVGGLEPSLSRAIVGTDRV